MKTPCLIWVTMGWLQFCLRFSKLFNSENGRNSLLNGTVKWDFQLEVFRIPTHKQLRWPKQIYGQYFWKTISAVFALRSKSQLVFWLRQKFDLEKSRVTISLNQSFMFRSSSRARWAATAWAILPSTTFPLLPAFAQRPRR